MPDRRGPAAALLTAAVVGMPCAAVAASVIPVGGVGRAPSVVATTASERVRFRLEDDRISESSGLALSVRHPHTVWTVNDSGDSARLFAVDTRVGRTVGVHTFDAPVQDVEALAITAQGRVLVADLGDNTGSRTVVRVFWFDEPSLGTTAGGWASWELSYPDGPHNAEALAVDPGSGRVLVVTKERPGGLYALPAAPSRTGLNRLTKVGTAPDSATDAVFLADGSGLAVRTYTSLVVLDPATWRVRSSQPLPLQPQGETIALAPGGTGLLVGSEGRRSLVQEVDLATVAPPKTAAPSAPATTRAGPERRDDDPTVARTAADAHEVMLGVGGALGLVAMALLVARLARRQRR